MFHKFVDPTYVTRRFDANGNLIKEYPMISNYWFPSLPVFPQSNGGNSGIEDVLTQDVSDFGILYNLQGISIKNNVEFGKWDGLNSGIYIWRNENKTHKFIIP